MEFRWSDRSMLFHIVTFTFTLFFFYGLGFNMMVWHVSNYYKNTLIALI